MSGFNYRKSLSGAAQVPAELQIIGGNSVVFQKGDLIRIDQDGFAGLVTAGDLVLGVVTGVVTNKGVPLDPDSGTLDTWTMGSANESTAAQKYKVQYIPALQDYLFYNDSDDTLAQANLMQFFAVNDENDVDGTTGSDTVLNTVRLVEIDPDNDADASKGLQ